MKISFCLKLSRINYSPIYQIFKEKSNMKHAHGNPANSVAKEVVKGSIVSSNGAYGE